MPYGTFSSMYNVTFSNSIETLEFTMTVNGSGEITSFVFNGDDNDKQSVFPGGTYNSTLNKISDLSIVSFSEFETLLNIIPDGPYVVSSDNDPFSNAGTVQPSTGEQIDIYEISISISLPEIIIVEARCFNEGTKILCLNKEEEYVPIENLRVGDIVKTYHYGYRKIELIGKHYLMNHPDNKFTNSMYKMAKTESNGLIEDLIVTGGHSILVDDLGNQKELNEQLLGEEKIEDKFLLLAAASNDFVKINDTEKYTYYHFVLEDNGNDKMKFGVWANGVLSETISKHFFLISF
jgi:hypothetical protein